MVVVLAVDSIGDSAAERDKPGAGHDREEPPPRHDYPDNLIKGQARFAAQNSLLGIEPDQAPELPGAQLCTVTVDTDVTVALALPVSQGGILTIESGQRLEAPVTLDHAGGFGKRQATPGHRHRSDAATTRNCLPKILHASLIRR